MSKDKTKHTEPAGFHIPAEDRTLKELAKLDSETGECLQCREDGIFRFECCDDGKPNHDCGRADCGSGGGIHLSLEHERGI